MDAQTNILLPVVLILAIALLASWLQRATTDPLDVGDLEAECPATAATARRTVRIGLLLIDAIACGVAALAIGYAFGWLFGVVAFLAVGLYGLVCYFDGAAFGGRPLPATAAPAAALVRLPVVEMADQTYTCPVHYYRHLCCQTGSAPKKRAMADKKPAPDANGQATHYTRAVYILCDVLDLLGIFLGQKPESP